MIHDHEDVQLIDVRGEEMYEKNHIETAINVPIKTLRDKGTPIPDVAAVLAACVDIDKTIGKVYTINAGTHPIDDSLSNIGFL